MVRNIGGLRDTVTDMGDWQGFGIRFDQPTVWDITYSVGRAIDPVSYTHLRAHETVLDLVCRLLLEKKKKNDNKQANRSP